MLPLAAQEPTTVGQTTYDGVTYTLWSDGTASIEQGQNPTQATLNLRATVTNDGITYALTRIGNEAFLNKTMFTGNLVVPNGVVSIGNSAFSGCTNLTGTLTLPEGLESIENLAFNNCGFTGQLVLPNSLTNLGMFAFAYCKFTGQLTLPPLLTEIPAMAFYGIEFTGDLTIPDGVTNIGSLAFQNNRFGNIYCGNGVTTIANGAFRYTAASHIEFGRNVQSIGDEAFAYYRTLYSYEHHFLTIECRPFTPPHLGTDVFKNHEIIGGTIIQGGVTIPCGTFSDYENDATWIANGFGHHSFTEAEYQTAKIGDVYYKLVCDGHTATVMNSAYQESSQGASYSGDVVIPATVDYEGITYSVTSIAPYAFYFCQSVTSVTLGSNIQSIGDEAFGYCTGLTQIISQNPTPPTLDFNTFNMAWQAKTAHVPCGASAAYQASDWNRLTNVMEGEVVEMDGLYYALPCSGATATLVRRSGYATSLAGTLAVPATIAHGGNTYTVTEIAANAFQGCTGLSTIVLPSGLTAIGSGAFKDCSNVTGIESAATVPPAAASEAFDGIPTTATVNVPTGTTTAYQAAAEWSRFSNYNESIVFADANVRALCIANWDSNGDGFLHYDEAAAVTTLGDVFYNQDDIVTFNELQYFTGLTTIGAAFTDCANLASVILPSTVTSIGPNTFRQCENLVSVGLPDGLESIGSFTFAACTSLATISFPEGLLSIGQQAFNTCTALASITIPASVTSIGSSAFGGCSSLVSITVASGNTAYDSRGGCNAIIDSRTHELVAGCRNTIVPATVTAIGNQAFSGCAALTNIALPASLVTIGTHAFNGCSGLAEITLPNTLTSIGNFAFYGCSGLSSIDIPATVTNIGTWVFYGCENIPEVYFHWTDLTGITWGDYNRGNDFNKPSGTTIHVPIGTIAAYQAWAPAWSGSFVADFAEINDKADLMALATYANNNSNPTAGLRWVQTADIDLAGETWTPIGTFVHPFRGTYDGQGHSISNIGGALFGSIEAATLTRIHIASGTVGNLTSTFSQGNHVGSIVGRAHGNSTMTLCTSAADISTTTGDAGGLAGKFHGTISHCAFTGTIAATSTTGGLVGSSGGDAYSAQISNSYVYTTAITGGSNVGCLVGWLHSGSTLSNSYAYTNGAIGSLCGNQGVTGITGSSAKSQAAFSGGEVCYLLNGSSSDNPVWYQTLGSDAFPVLDEGHLVVCLDGATYYNTGAFTFAVAGYGETTGGYKFIASPIGGSNEAATVGNIFGASAYDLYRFDQSEEQEWRNHKIEPFELENGQGYLYASKEDVNLVFRGTYNTATEPVEVPLAYSEANPSTAMRGFNLVGNPFPVAAYADKSYYKMNAAGTAIEPVAVSSATPIDACTGVMVKAETTGETVTFSRTAQQSAGNNGTIQIAVAKASEPVEGPTRNSGTSTSSVTALDKAIVSFNAGDRLEKFVFGQTDATIYIPHGGKDYAVATVGRDAPWHVSTTDEIPINFKAAKNGTYTLTFDTENLDLDYLHLIDNLTGADIDLLTPAGSSPSERGAGGVNQPSYTFTAKTTDYASRFKLLFVCEDANHDNDAPFAYISNGNIIINGGPSTGSGTSTLQVVDMMGRVVVSTDVARNVSTSGMAPSLYVLRLIDGETVRTQKIVVR